MKAQEEFNYIVMVIQDHVNSLVPSSKIAVQQQVQAAVNAVAEVLVAAETPPVDKNPVSTPLPTDAVDAMPAA